MNRGKAQKEPLTLTERDYNPALDKSLLALEDICARLLETNFSEGNDSERTIWQQRFRNIITNVSLAMAEVGGTRRFHFHYRHDRKDNSKMLPVLENPLDLLAHTCELALQESAKKLSSTHDRDLLAAQRQLESAIRNFLVHYSRAAA